MSLIDFAPTLLDAAGITVPNELSGQSFLPLVNNKDTEWKNEVFIQISESQVGRAIRTKRWKYSVSNLSIDPVEHDKASIYQEEFLYYLEADPYELTNLIELKSHSKVKEHLRESLVDYILKVEGETLVIQSVTEMESGQRKVLFKEIDY
nr:sulfatase/phosphatase domain-containing protein [Gracilibacillus orientalis]